MREIIIFNNLRVIDLKESKIYWGSKDPRGNILKSNCQTKRQAACNNYLNFSFLSWNTDKTKHMASFKKNKYFICIRSDQKSSYQKNPMSFDKIWFCYAFKTDKFVVEKITDPVKTIHFLQTRSPQINKIKKLYGNISGTQNVKTSERRSTDILPVV